VASNPDISFIGSLFVFSGFDHAFEKEYPIVQKVMEHGGQYRSKVSGLTNYLVVDPSLAGDSKMEAAIEQLKKGKSITIVLLDDIERALEEPVDTVRIAQEAAARQAKEEAKRITLEQEQLAREEKRKAREAAKAMSSQTA
jgi:hypothetical protein